MGNPVKQKKMRDINKQRKRIHISNPVSTTK